MKYIKCPFCVEDDFDLEGLKLHLLKWCDHFRNISIEDTEIRPIHTPHIKPSERCGSPHAGSSTCCGCDTSCWI